VPDSSSDINAKAYVKENGLTLKKSILTVKLYVNLIYVYSLHKY